MSFHSRTEINYTTDSEMERGKKTILTGFFFNAENNHFSITEKYKGDFAHCEKK